MNDVPLLGVSVIRNGKDVDGQSKAHDEVIIVAKRRDVFFYSWTALEVTLAGFFSYAFDYVFHNVYCGMLFRCHCTWPWAGGASRCNIHNPPDRPRCPWCNVRNGALSGLAWAITDRFAVSMMTLSYICVILFRELRNVPVTTGIQKPRLLAVRLAAPVVTFLVLGFAMGLLFYKSTDYPCFLWIKDAATECGFKNSSRTA